jgi:hypothetical protein
VPKIYRCCLTYGQIAEIRICCPIFIHQADKDGSRLRVVSSTKKSPKWSLGTIFSTLLAILQLTLCPFYFVSGPDLASAYDIDILGVATEPKIDCHSDRSRSSSEGQAIGPPSRWQIHIQVRSVLWRSSLLELGSTYCPPCAVAHSLAYQPIPPAHLIAIG